MKKYCRTKGTQKTFPPKFMFFWQNSLKMCLMRPNTIIWVHIPKLCSYDSNYEYLAFWGFKKYVRTNSTEKKFGFLENREFSKKKFFLVPFGCTYLFWDNMAYIIQKFINCRIFFVSCSFFNSKYFRSYRFQKFSEKKYWFFLKFGDLVENPLFFAR